MKKIYFLFITFTGLLLSCSGKPEISDLENDLKSQIVSESEGRIELTKLQKINAVDKEVFGQKVYTIAYEATIKFNEDFYMYYNKSGYGPMFESFKTYKTEPEFVPSLQLQVGLCERGKDFTYQGSATYCETEEGWVLSN